MTGNIVPITDYAPSNVDFDYRCGNSKFSDDIWDFKGFIDAPHWNNAKFKLNFQPFNNWKPIKDSIKKYILSELLIVSFNSVKRKLAAFKQLINFLNVNPHVGSFCDFTDFLVRDYFIFLCNYRNENGNLLSAISIKKSSQVFKEMLIRGSKRDWEVPSNTVNINAIYNELILNNVSIKKGTKFGATKKVLPEKEIINNIIRLSMDCINKGQDVLTCASILLSSQLGLRISEVILIKQSCIKIIGGEYYISYTTSKTLKTPEMVTRPANEIVVTTIRALEQETRQLREDSGLPFLFLIKHNNNIMVARHSTWNKNRLKPFISKYDIRNKNGELVNLTHHYFRHIFATYALKAGMRIHDVAEMMNHKSIMMTEVYDHTKDEKQSVIKDILSGDIPVTSTNKIVLESIEGSENPFKGLTVAQSDKMRRALKIELLPHGLCLHHPMRGDPCDQDGVCLGCHEFLASAKHLSVYENRLNRVNQELQNLNNDKSIYTTKLRFQQGILEKYISELQVKMGK